MPAPADSTRIVKMHDAKPLVTVKVPGQDAEQARAARKERLDRIASFARTFVQPPLAAEEDITSLSGRYLVALARPAQQKWIEQLLQRNIEEGQHQIDLEIRLLGIQDKDFDGLMPPFGTDPEPVTPNKPIEVSPGRYQAMLDDTELNLILRACEKMKSVDMLTAPRILLNRMTPATIQVGEEVDFIKDYDVQVKDGKQVAKPVREQLFDGMRIDASCGLVQDDLLGISFRYQQRKVEKPIPEFKTTIGVGNTVTVQLPASTLLELEQQLEMLDGQTAMLAVRNGKGPHLMFLVRASLVPTQPVKIRKGRR